MTTIDARGLACPLPLTMAKRRMAGVARGEVLIVYATDPEAPLDLAAWAEDEGHAFAAEERSGWVEITLRKGGP